MKESESQCRIFKNTTIHIAESAKKDIISLCQMTEEEFMSNTRPCPFHEESELKPGDELRRCIDCLPDYCGAEERQIHPDEEAIRLIRREVGPHNHKCSRPVGHVGNHHCCHEDKKWCGEWHLMKLL